MEWHPSVDYSNIIALGQTNGKVLLRSVNTAQEKGSLLAGKEFQTKNQKACSCVAWNASNPSWLAVGLEKHGRYVSISFCTNKPCTKST